MVIGRPISDRKPKVRFWNFSQQSCRTGWVIWNAIDAYGSQPSWFRERLSLQQILANLDWSRYLSSNCRGSRDDERP